ncbi:NAD(P)H-dependent oxidoreductase [Streptomyces sp. B1866]|uniref:NADPH-dependent FMN reductase n=1 Tax=Streptomyces sp. B1866 TaxID=3075431 RepID=UPI0028902CF8|nr:NAD(P)H-dependent oxidoreductase [Streptomyces sp. B1866]MDT3400292.1 NAD(P)H-dependent oxidoreductase [Streptomyces sp. B1866]
MAGSGRVRGARPLVIGIGGSGAPGSATERALVLALGGAERAGADTRLFGGAFLGGLPLFRPGPAARCAAVCELLDATARAEGVIVASPSYHGGVSAMVKNALDHLEDLREDARPYLDGRAVGCVVTAAGRQTGGTTLVSLRSIVHALRGWPTPLGVTVRTGPSRPRTGGQDGAEDGDEERLAVVGRQVAEFAAAFGRARAAVAGAPR